MTSEQRQVVLSTDSNIAVIGPPGTGKTRVLTERIKYLLGLGVKPKDIVAITFTNYAANEMKSRLEDSGDMFIGTMHSYAAQILLRNGEPVDFEKMSRENDFSSLITKVNLMHYDLPPIKYLFVDEVQDLCDYEFDFIMMLPYENIFLGGDADQCIYQFKGARPELFNNFCRKPTTTLYTLTHNFRCGQNIIDFADFFVANLPGRIKVNVTGNMHDRGWINRTTFEEAIMDIYLAKNFKKWFILTRTNAELDEAARILDNYYIPYTSFKQADLTNEEIDRYLNYDEVKLLTIHSAKGLETDNVIVVGAKNWDREEKCIEYVAATRARKLLYWCPSIAKRVTRKSYFEKHVHTGKVWE